MNLLPEIYRGIEYIRISSLPKEQKEMIWSTFPHDKIIKIVKDQALLNDCILYHDFVAWAAVPHIAKSAVAAPSNGSALEGVFVKLAFK
ncbi:MAG: hypothetical protein U0289_01105 [Cyclobacteriaceae bacterium]|jgi:hypothetical protein|nr:hypothetical protein [Cytophagales bacterium]HNP75646.1 hypothetical protein [Cyclobacteriaceae bacterium]